MDKPACPQCGHPHIPCPMADAEAENAFRAIRTEAFLRGRDLGHHELLLAILAGDLPPALKVEAENAYRAMRRENR